MATQEDERGRELLDTEIDGDQLGDSDTEDECMDDDATEEQYTIAYNKRIRRCEAIGMIDSYEVAETQIEADVIHLQSAVSFDESAQIELKVLYNIQRAIEREGTLEVFIRKRRERDARLVKMRTELTSDEEAASDAALEAMRDAIREGTMKKKKGISSFICFGNVDTAAFGDAAWGESDGESDDDSDGESDEDKSGRAGDGASTAKARPLPRPAQNVKKPQQTQPRAQQRVTCFPALPPMLPTVAKGDREPPHPTVHVAQTPPKRRRVQVEVIDLTSCAVE